MRATVYVHHHPSRWEGPAARDLYVVSVVAHLPGNEELNVNPEDREVWRWTSLTPLTRDIPAVVGQVLFEHILEQRQEIERLGKIEEEAILVMDTVTHGFREDIDFRALRAALGGADDEPGQEATGPDAG